MADDSVGVLAFVENALHVRETYYRDKAARLRELAETEPVARFRKNLIDLAEQFEALADTISRREHRPANKQRGTGGTSVSAEYEVRYRGFRITARALNGTWQAKIEGIGALSDHRPTARDAISVTKRYLDEQAAERLPPR